MPALLAQKDSTYVLNHCTKYLARDNSDARHDYGQYETGDPRARISEAWRFPVIDSITTDKIIRRVTPSISCHSYMTTAMGVLAKTLQ